MVDLIHDKHNFIFHKFPYGQMICEVNFMYLNMILFMQGKFIHLHWKFHLR
jgi:hypothetical protein